MRQFLFVLMAAMLLNACGAKGPLYLPDKQYPQPKDPQSQDQQTQDQQPQDPK
jgi:predicted small lipoprotein YifL